MSSLAQNGATPYRRSARLSQAGSVTEQSVRTAVTPGGSRQPRKKAALIKVKARKSNAYGASGRVGAAEELTVSDTGFAQAFQNQRGDAVARDDDDDEEEEEDEEGSTDELGAETPRMSGAINNGRVYRRSPSTEPRRHLRAPSNFSFEESEVVTPSDGFDTSIANTSKSFGLAHEAGMLSQPTRVPSPSKTAPNADLPLWQRNTARRSQLANQATPKEKDVVEISKTSVHRVLQVNQIQSPPSVSVPARPTPQARVPAQNTNPVSRANLSSQRVDKPQVVREWFDRNEFEKEEEDEWQWKRIMLWIFGALLIAMLACAWSAADDRNTSTGYGYGESLGSFVSRSRHQVAKWIRPNNAFNSAWGSGTKVELGNDSDGRDGLKTRVQQLYTDLDTRMDDMQEVIMMLKNDIPETMVVRNNGGRHEITDDFWQALISKAESSPREWESFLQRNAKKISGIVGVPRSPNGAGSGPVMVSREEFLRLVEERYTKLAAQIERRSEEIIESRMSQMRTISQIETRKSVLDSIRQQSLAQGNLQASYELNLLKANFFSAGLGAVVDPALSSATFSKDTGFLSKWTRRVAATSQRNPPIAAISKWEEPGDCWCAAPEPSMKGQAQLVVSLPQPVFPTQVTIEHTPMTMVPGKNIDNAPRHIEFWVQTDQPVQSMYAKQREACKDGPTGWSCLGAFKYNIHASNHVQTFDLDAESSVPVSKTMVRVLSNWGSEITCLYRVRLHGRTVGEDHQYKVVLNDPVEE